MPRLQELGIEAVYSSCSNISARKSVA